MTYLKSSQLALGLKLKADGQSKVGAVSSEWIEDVLKWASELWQGEPVTAETIRFHWGAPPRPNAMGTVLSLAARRGLIEFDRYEKSSRPSRHASVTGVWRRT